MLNVPQRRRPAIAATKLTTPGQIEAQRKALVRRAWAHYDGAPPKPLRVEQGEPDDNVILSFARLLVDKGVSYLFGQAVTSELPEAAAGAQTWLDECWRRNKRAITLQKLATNGGVTGHAFARLLDDSPFPRVVVLDTQVVDVVWSDDDVDDVERYIITLPSTEDADRRQLILRNDVGTIDDLEVEGAPEQWTICDQIDSPPGNGWQTVRTAPWPYPFSPIAHCQNLPRPNDFWGVADLPVDVLAVLHVINRVASHYAKIIRVHAHPKTWSRGLGNKVLKMGISDVINLPSETAELHNLEMTSDLDSTRALIDLLIDVLSWMTRIPTVAFGRPDGAGALSGVAMQLRYAPIVEKTEQKRLTYGDLLTELDMRLLTMGGMPQTEAPQLHWPELLPSDPLQERQAMILDDSLGVSTETILEKLGYDPKLEMSRKATEAIAAAKRQMQLMPQPGSVPPPAPVGAPQPDVAKP